MPAAITTFAAGRPLPSSIYVDANIVVASATRSDRFHEISTRFLLESLKQGRKLRISTLTLDESIHVVIKLLHKASGVEYNPKTPAHNAKFAANAQAVVDRLFSISATELYVPKDPRNVVKRAIDALSRHKLAPRDSFHLAHALEGHIEGFATTDGDFNNLTLDDNETLTVVRLR